MFTQERNLFLFNQSFLSWISICIIFVNYQWWREQYCFHNYTDQSRRARHNDCWDNGGVVMMIIYDKTLIKQIRRSCRFLHNFIIHSFLLFFSIYTLYHLNTKEGRLTKSKKKKTKRFCCLQQYSRDCFCCCRLCMCVRPDRTSLTCIYHTRRNLVHSTSI
jgi:glycosyltransferase involved in cell wall biosynthesis